MRQNQNYLRKKGASVYRLRSLIVETETISSAPASFLVTARVFFYY
ncbi:hypothetical protein RV11_GL003419 [Enterococcus phoeniculicola]|jgi:hypothetical protein|nr:hypothetical protein [Enterococcus phoeniculicola]OJG71698.1 hypothetical protein RV11_GL003419 [Enterococcus phoeniculicola]